MHNVNIFPKFLYLHTFPGRNSRTLGIGEKERKEMVNILGERAEVMLELGIGKDRNIIENPLAI